MRDLLTPGLEACQSQGASGSPWLSMVMAFCRLVLQGTAALAVVYAVPGSLEHMGLWHQNDCHTAPVTSRAPEPLSYCIIVYVLFPHDPWKFTLVCGAVAVCKLSSLREECELLWIWEGQNARESSSRLRKACGFRVRAVVSQPRDLVEPPSGRGL